MVVDHDDEVHGGFLLMTQPGWLKGAIVEVPDYQAPLSEGIIDLRYGMVGMHMLRYVQKHWPLTFAVRIGGIDRPLPRLLQAAGWQVRAVPFLFHVVKTSRVLRELRMLQERPPLRLAARAGALTGAGAIGVAALQHRAWTSDHAAREIRVERIERWDGWADRLWQRARGEMVFSVLRDCGTLESLYPLADPKIWVHGASGRRRRRMGRRPQHADARSQSLRESSSGHCARRRRAAERRCRCRVAREARARGGWRRFDVTNQTISAGSTPFAALVF